MKARESSRQSKSRHHPWKTVGRPDFATLLESLESRLLLSAARLMTPYFHGFNPIAQVTTP